MANYSHWKSHGRPLNIDVLTNELKLQVDDFSELDAIQDVILNLHYIAEDFMRINGIQAMVLSRRSNI